MGRRGRVAAKSCKVGSNSQIVAFSMSKRTTHRTTGALRPAKTKGKGPGKPGPPKTTGGQGAAPESGASAQSGSSGGSRGGGRQGGGGGSGGGKGPDRRYWQRLRKAAFRQAEKELPKLFERYLPHLSKVPIEIDDLNEDSLLDWELEWNAQKQAGRDWDVEHEICIRVPASVFGVAVWSGEKAQDQARRREHQTLCGMGFGEIGTDSSGATYLTLTRMEEHPSPNHPLNQRRASSCVMRAAWEYAKLLGVEECRIQRTPVQFEREHNDTKERRTFTRLNFWPTPHGNYWRRMVNKGEKK